MEEQKEKARARDKTRIFGGATAVVQAWAGPSRYFFHCCPFAVSSSGSLKRFAWLDSPVAADRRVIIIWSEVNPIPLNSDPNYMNNFLYLLQPGINVTQNTFGNIIRHLRRWTRNRHPFFTYLTELHGRLSWNWISNLAEGDRKWNLYRINIEDRDTVQRDLFSL